MNKIKLLVCNIGNAGVGKFRFKDPHIALQKAYKVDFFIDIVTNPPIQDKKYMSKYDGVFLQSSSLITDQYFQALEELKKDGLKVIVDVDDYWRLPREHAMHNKMEKSWKALTQRFKIADLITTTTKYLAAKISRYNKNIAIIPNAIDPNEKQFNSNPIESDRVRIGWIGGSSHLEDLKLLRGLANKMINTQNNVQMIMAGFNNQVRDIATGKLTTQKRPKTWMECEYIMTASYNLDEQYKHYLLHPVEQQYEDIVNQPYKRVWTKPIQTYATTYNELDIALAPLVDNTFNKMKSQLKVIEAGFHKKALIASNIEPYRIDCLDKQNSILVDSKKAHKDFAKYGKLLVENESMRNELGQALYETVKDKYDLNKVTHKRAKAYKKIF